MRRVLVGLFAALFFVTEAAAAFHHHSGSLEASGCAVCVAVDQARAAPAAAPSAVAPSSFVAVVVEARLIRDAARSSVVPARGPPSIA
jgi:hypothetical protein